MYELFSNKKNEIHGDLCNNFDTGSMFERIDELVKQTNIYSSLSNPKQLLLRSIYEYLIKIFSSLGLNYENDGE